MTPDEHLATLDRLEGAMGALHEASLAALALARSQLEDARARGKDADEWTRLPREGERCPVSGLSRSTINRRINDPDPKRRIRTKTLGAARYYSASDLRAQLK